MIVKSVAFLSFFYDTLFLLLIFNEKLPEELLVPVNGIASDLFNLLLSLESMSC